MCKQFANSLIKIVSFYTFEFINRSISINPTVHLIELVALKVSGHRDCHRPFEIHIYNFWGDIGKQRCVDDMWVGAFNVRCTFLIECWNYWWSALATIPYGHRTVLKCCYVTNETFPGLSKDKWQHKNVPIARYNARTRRPSSTGRHINPEIPKNSISVRDMRVYVCVYMRILDVQFRMSLRIAMWLHVCGGRFVGGSYNGYSKVNDKNHH